MPKRRRQRQKKMPDYYLLHKLVGEYGLVRVCIGSVGVGIGLIKSELLATRDVSDIEKDQFSSSTYIIALEVVVTLLDL